MGRKKKITVKHYLNKKLKPTIGADSDLLHPLYVRIRYDGAMTEIKSNYYQYSPELKSVTFYEAKPVLSESQLKNPIIRKAIEFEEDTIYTVLQKLNELVDNPVNQFSSSFYSDLSKTFESILNRVISYKIQPIVKKHDELLHQLINWFEFKIENLKSVQDKYFKLNLIDQILLNNQYLKELIEIHRFIISNQEINRIKLFIVFLNDENILELPKSLLNTYHRLKIELLEVYGNK